MEIFSRILDTPPLREALLPLPAAAEAFLVGGALRNARLGLPVTDFDFATPFDPTPLARAFATHCRGRWFLLDPSRSQSRVVWSPPHGPQLTFDFAPFRAADLDGDLRGRDFTINALALALGSGEVCDPLGGEGDLVARRLRDCAPTAFSDDPLRILRMVRLVVTLGFSVENGTLERAARFADLLAYVPAERRGDEVVRIVNHAQVSAGLDLLEELGLTPHLFGPDGAGGPRWRQNAGEVLGRLEEFAAWLHGHSSQLAALLDVPVGHSLTRLGRLRLAGLLAPFSLDAAGLDARLALGRETLAVLEQIVPLVRSPLAPPTLRGQRAMARWAGEEPYVEDRLLFAAAMTVGTGARKALLEALTAYLELQQEGRIPDLVDGHWISDHLDVPPGPQLGELVAALRAAELSGAVENPDEARKFLNLLREKTIDKKNGVTL